MTAFDVLQNHYISKNMGNLGNSRALFRNESSKDPSHVIDTELEREGEPIVASVEKGHEAEAKETAADHGVDPDSPEGRAEIMQILEGIRKKNADAKRMQGIQKARPRKEGPYRAGTQMAEGGTRTTPQKRKKAGKGWKIVGHSGDIRDTDRADYQPFTSDASPGTEKYAKYSRWWESTDEDGNPKKKARASEKAIINMEKAHVSPHLARLLAAAAGWALSGDIAGKVAPHLAQEWDRATSMHDKKRLQEDMMRQMHRMHRKPQAKLLIIHRKSDDGNFLEESPAFDDLNMFYKDHAPIPPRYGLMGDAVKHRWTRPEKIGRTVWEVQGKKRYRGTGTGAHERGRKAGGSGGYGSGSSEAGRRFRSTGDIGRLHPHESKHPGQHTLHRFGKVRKLPKRR